MSGSLSFAALASLATLSITGMQMLMSSRSTKAKISEAQNQNASVMNEANAMNTGSIVKALLTGSGTADYIPAYYADHYYMDLWSFKQNTAIALPKSTVLSNGGKTIGLTAGPDMTIKDEDLVSIMGGKSILTVNAATSLATVIGIKRSNDVGKENLVESVDLRIDSTFTQNGVEKKYSQGFRIPVPEPLPYNIKLEVRPKSGGPWTDVSSLPSLKPDLYEGQVKVSGVALNAIVERNGVQIASKSGINPDGSVLAHKADNVMAKDIVIIDPFPIDLRDKADQAACRYIAADDSFEFVTKVSGPGGTYVNITTNVPNANAAANADIPLDQLKTIYTTKCLKECPFAGPTDSYVYGVEDDYWRGTSPLGVRYYGSLAVAPQIFEGLSFGIRGGRKLCLNSTKVAAAFQAGTGTKLDRRFDLDAYNSTLPLGVPWISELAEFYAYDPNTCAETKIFARDKCGCFADKTRITLGDGKSEKAISEIRYSDRVWNPILKKSFAIRKITRGPEPVPMISILVDGKELIVTGKHPFPTHSGIKVAHILEEGEEIELADGRWTPIDSIKAVPPGKEAPVVWNIEIDAPNEDLNAHHVVANGVITGDLFIQTKMESAGGQVLKASND